MARVSDEIRTLLDEVAHRLPVILGANLVGIYLYGSLTQRAFDPKRSDLDLLVVTRRALSGLRLRKIRAWLDRKARSNPWSSRLQMSFLLRDQILTANSKSCLYQFGRLKRCRSDGNPIVWLNVLESGVTLCGARPESFVPVITREILLRALQREVGYLREEIVEKPRSKWRDVPFYRAYAVMTLCRILYSLRNNQVVSKPRAAKWAIKHLPRRWAGTVIQARESDAGRRRRPIALSQIRELIDFANAELRPVVSRRSAPRP